VRKRGQTTKRGEGLTVEGRGGQKAYGGDGQDCGEGVRLSLPPAVGPSPSPHCFPRSVEITVFFFSVKIS